MSGFDWFQYHPSKIENDLWKFSAAQMGVLLLLGGKAYESDDCSINSDPEWIRRVDFQRFPELRHPKRYDTTVLPVLNECFSKPHEGRMSCNWLHDQFMEASEICKDKSKAAHARWERARKNNEAGDAP